MRPKPMKVFHWKTFERHKLGAGYSDIDGETFDAMVEAIKNGTVHTITILGEGVLDGWQRYRAHLKADIKPNFVRLPNGKSPEEFVAEQNDHRRHESVLAVEARIKARRERVAEAYAAGKSVRTIATEEQIPKSTVHRDLETVAGVPLSESGTPDSGNNQAETSQSPKNGRVTGQDGKSYPAKKQCERCQRVGPVPDCTACAALRQKPAKKPKNGQPTIPEKAFQKTFNESFGRLSRLLDSRNAKAKGVGYQKCRDLLNLFFEAYKAWLKEAA